MSNYQHHINNNIDFSDLDDDSLTYSDDNADEDTETSLMQERNELMNYYNTIACFFDHRCKNSKINLICYNCNSEPKMEDIVAFGERQQNKIKNFDVPFCPYCGETAIVDADKLKQKKKEDTHLLFQMSNLMNK